MKNVGKLLVVLQTLLNMEEFIMVRNHVYVRNVTRPFVMLELRLHHRICSGAKPFECVKCGNSFMYISNFKPHLRIHTGKKTMNGRNVGRSLEGVRDLLNIIVFILVRNLINVTCMVIALVSVQPSQRIHTGEKPC